MAETTPQKRVLPARERHGSTSKRRASSVAPPSSPPSEPRQKRKYTKRASLIKLATPAAATPAPSSSAGEALPTKLQTSKPLPTAATKQEKVSDRDYQSIADSAVLAASLHQSRMQWLCEGIFQRYWTKPVKRKGVIEQPPGNPDVKSMHKLGNATMTIEPHTFDVTFHTVKHFTSGSIPYQRHPNQHTAKQPQQAPAPAPAPAPALAPSAPSSTVSASTSAPVTQSTLFKAAASTTTPTPVSVQAPIPGDDTQIQKQESPPEHRTDAKGGAQITGPTPTQPPSAVVPTNLPPKPTGDPVIQMLAARAATDNRLKELMKVVAMSQATPDQLKEFQTHIDEFNKMIKQQETKKGETEKNQSSSTGSQQVMNKTVSSRPTYSGQPAGPNGPAHLSSSSSHATHVQPRTESFIKNIVVEFHSAASASQNASTDRWLFPEYAVLDIKAGGMEMVASFLVERKGEDVLKRQGLDRRDDEADPPLFKPGVDYYQPVTVTIKATQHRTIETIARAAKPLVECQKHMKEIMSNKTRAPQEYLVFRLPKDQTSIDGNLTHFVDSAVEMSGEEDDELKNFYRL